jgi:hypothetical protein
MMQWVLENLQAIVTTAGLVCDIIGAWLIAFEVVRQYRGTQYKTRGTGYRGESTPEKTGAYITWEHRRSKFMWAGLIFLTIGFAGQSVATWIP